MVFTPRHLSFYHARSRAGQWVWPVLALPLLAFLLVPIVSVAVKAPPALLARYLGNSATVQAIALSLGTSVAATVAVVAMGTPIAHILAKWQFPGRGVLDVLVDLPTVLPPAVAGLALLAAFGRQGVLGPLLRGMNVQIAFTPLAVVMAQAFVSAPYYIKSACVGLSYVTEDLEDAAAVDGATHLQVFRHISVPLAWRSLVGGGGARLGAGPGRVRRDHHLRGQFSRPDADHAAGHLYGLRDRH